MDLTKKMLIPLGIIGLVGACAPYMPSPLPFKKRPAVKAEPSNNQNITSTEQRQIKKTRNSIKRDAERKRNTQRKTVAKKKNTKKKLTKKTNTPAPSSPKPTKPNYPTATAVPGKPGFVFNPYTHNIVDVKGIGSGKLVRDPEDGNSSHKFRVP